MMMRRVLERLIGFDTVSAKSNLELLAYVRELLADGAGTVVAPGDDLALREAVQQVRHQMLGLASQEALDAVLKKHTWAAISMQYEALFSECLRSGREPRV